MPLVLTRRPGQSIHIGDGENAVVVTVAEVRGDQIRLAVTADRSVPVHRTEVLQELAAQNQQAASAPRAHLPRPTQVKPQR